MPEPLSLCWLKRVMAVASWPAQLHHTGLPMAPREVAVRGEEEAGEVVMSREAGEMVVKGRGT